MESDQSEGPSAEGWFDKLITSGISYADFCDQVINRHGQGGRAEPDKVRGVLEPAGNRRDDADLVALVC